jgi:hypothetical protein
MYGGMAGVKTLCFGLVKLLHRLANHSQSLQFSHPFSSLLLSPVDNVICSIQKMRRLLQLQSRHTQSFKLITRWTSEKVGSKERRSRHQPSTKQIQTITAFSLLSSENDPRSDSPDHKQDLGVKIRVWIGPWSTRRGRGLGSPFSRWTIRWCFT